MPAEGKLRIPCAATLGLATVTRLFDNKTARRPQIGVTRVLTSPFETDTIGGGQWDVGGCVVSVQVEENLPPKMKGLVKKSVFKG